MHGAWARRRALQHTGPERAPLAGASGNRPLELPCKKRGGQMLVRGRAQRQFQFLPPGRQTCKKTHKVGKRRSAHGPRAPRWPRRAETIASRAGLNSPVGPEATTRPGERTHFPVAAPTSGERPRVFLGSRKVCDAAAPTGGMGGVNNVGGMSDLAPGAPFRRCHPVNSFLPHPPLSRSPHFVCADSGKPG